MGDYDFMLQSYAVCAGLLWFFYTLTQFSAVDAKAHPPEDAQLMEKDIEKQNKAEADGDWDVSFTNSGARGQTLQTLALAINAPRTSVYHPAIASTSAAERKELLFASFLDIPFAGSDPTWTACS